MSRIIFRSVGFGLLAALATGIAGAVFGIVSVGLPSSQSALPEFQRQAEMAALGAQIPINAIGLFLFGWLAARPFRGRDALIVAVLVAVVQIALEVGAAGVMGRLGGFAGAGLATNYGTRLVAALLGGLLASRGRATA